MFENYINPIKRRKLGLYGEDIIGAEDGAMPVQPTGMLNDAETTARMQALYPMKSEFNDAWVQSREDRETPFPVAQPLNTENYNEMQAVLPAPQGRELPEAPAQTSPVPYPVVNQAEPEAVKTVPYPVATQGRINSINQKDYSKAIYDEQGNLIKDAGKDRDKKWSTLEELGKFTINNFSERLQPTTQGNEFRGFQRPQVQPRETDALRSEAPRFTNFNAPSANRSFQTESPTFNAVNTPYPVAPTDDGLPTVINPDAPIQPTPSFNPNEQNKVATSRTRREVAQQKLDTLQGKDYSIKKDENGKVIYRGKDRDNDKNFLDFLKSAGIGALIGLSQGGIGGAIGGAIVGGFKGAIDRNADEKLLDTFYRLPKAKQELINAQYQEKFDSDMQTADANRQDKRADNERRDKLYLETKQKNIDLEYDKGFKRAMQQVKLGYKKGVNPKLDEELARYGVDIDQFDGNNRTFWQGQNLMTFDEKGEAVPVLNSKNEPVTDITRKPMTIDYEGQTFTVSQTTAFQGLTNAGGKNATITNQNADDDRGYKVKIGEFEAEIVGINSKLSKKRQLLSKIPDPATNQQDLDKREKLEKEIIDLESDLEKQQKLKENYPKPVQRQQTTSPSVSSGGIKPTESQAFQYFKSKGMSDEQAKAKVQQAKSLKKVQ